MNLNEHYERAGIVPGLLATSALPKTRLELRWEVRPEDTEWPMFCHYELVLELMDYDIRGEVHDDSGNLIERKKELRVSLGGTKAGNNKSRVNRSEATIDTPFRDHTHIRQDALRLGLPAFVLAEGLAMRLRPAKDTP